MSFAVNQTHVSAFAKEGIVKLKGAIDADLLQEIQSCWDWSVKHPGPFATGKTTDDQVFFVDNGNPDARSMYENLVGSTSFPQIAADLWQSSFIGFFAEEIFWKKGNAGKTETFWHQDTVYSPWGGEHWCNFWIPLVPMTGEQSIRVVRGSHLGVMYDGTTFNPKDPTEPLWGEAGNFPRLPDITADLERDPASWDVVSFDLEPGDVVVLHPHCLHSGGGSDPATLPDRRNIVLRFFGDRSHYSDHLPSMQGMYDHKPIKSASGGYLKDGDPYRPVYSPNLIA
ncbi:MAG: phytanoyl-CoA dioxygenase [Pseudomonadales bacterium]|nr:phytanoyl-CoA dioxygenase [Pseudomonadales bacterium]